jgi:hypothetical protein
MRRLSAVIIVVMVTGFIALIYNETSYAINASDLIFLKNEAPYGISYSEWIGRWWEWHVSIPNKINQQDPTNLTLAHPRESYSPQKCAWNQNDPNVWFLPDGRNLGLSEAGAPEKRECTVPHEKALLVQIYGGGYSYGEGLKTDNELKDCVNIGLDTVEFTAKVDGVEVMNSKNRDDYLPEPYKCKLKYEQNNLYDVPAETYDAMAGGYFLFVKPFKDEGHHTIEFEEKFSTQDYRGSSVATKMATDRISNVVYDLTVQ